MLKPTRQQLLLLRGRYGVIRKGLDLLKSKREALMKEFFGIVEETVKLRELLADALGAAQRSLEKARALDEPGVLSFASSARRNVDIKIKVKNVWGVNVPEVEEKPLMRALSARDISPVGVSTGVLEAARGFESATDLLVRIAARETRLQRIGEAIKADTRKINAITEVMLPTLGRHIKGIGRVLDEREREGVFRLKRYKTKTRER
ncbi:MAG: V-type ATP synthase subunit D [Thermodesulfobacteriota bacterium]